MPAEPKFAYADGYHARLPAEVVGPALVDLAGSNEVDALQPEHVVEAARPIHSPLHKAFDWDDTVAARQWRLEQARHLVRSIVVRIETDGGKPVKCPIFVNLRDGVGYRRSVKVWGREALRTLFLEQAEDDLKSARAKLAQVRGFGALVKQVAAVERAVMKGLRKKKAA